MTDGFDGRVDDAARAEALRVLSLLRDGRPVPAEEAQRARALAAADPGAAAMLAAWERQSAALAAQPARAASPGFTGRVLAAARGEQAQPAEVLVLSLVRRLALAAALLLSGTLGWSLAFPSVLRADPDVQRQRHAVDHFRPTPFAPDDLDAGLRGRYREVYGAGLSPEAPR